MKAKHKKSKVWQVPIVLERDAGDVIGVVTIDPTRVPKGSDWGLQPGVDGNDNIILFSTLKKGEKSSLVK